MNEYMQFLTAIAAIFAGIIITKAAFVGLRFLELKINPGAVKRPSDMPEAAFKNMRDKHVAIHLKGGEILRNVIYKKTLFFNEGDFAINTSVYFELENEDGAVIFIAGQEIARIECPPGAPVA